MARNMLCFEATEELKDKLKSEAEDREMSVSALIRWIIKEYFKKK